MSFLLCLCLCAGLNTQAQTKYTASGVIEYSLNKDKTTWDYEMASEGEMGLFFVYGKVVVDDNEGSVYFIGDMIMYENDRKNEYIKWNCLDNQGRGCYVVLSVKKRLFVDKYRVTIVYKDKLYDYPIKKARRFLR